MSALVEKLDVLTERHMGSRYRVLIVEDDPDLAVEYRWCSTPRAWRPRRS